MKVKINKIYDLIKATPEFKSLILKYKKERLSALNILKYGRIEFFEIEKQKELNKESNEEYLYNEIKNRQKVNEEMQNLHGVKAFSGSHSIKDMKNIEKRNSVIKVKKGKFFDLLNKKNKVFASDSNLIEKNIVPLPLIFPKNNNLNNKFISPNSFRALNNLEAPIIKTKKKRNQKRIISCLTGSSNINNKEMTKANSLCKYINSLDHLKEEYSICSKRLKKEISNF